MIEIIKDILLIGAPVCIAMSIYKYREHTSDYHLFLAIVFGLLAVSFRAVYNSWEINELKTQVANLSPKWHNK